MESKEIVSLIVFIIMSLIMITFWVLMSQEKDEWITDIDKNEDVNEAVDFDSMTKKELQKFGESIGVVLSMKMKKYIMIERLNENASGND